MINVGDILVCKKYHEQFDNKYIIVGNRCVVRKIESYGNRNIYVSLDLNGHDEEHCVCYSPVRFPSRKEGYSTMYIYDYFDELSEFRNNKLEKLGINES